MTSSSLTLSPTCTCISFTCGQNAALISKWLYKPSLPVDNNFTLVHYHHNNSRYLKPYCTDNTFPVIGANSGFCIFIASTTTMVVPSATESPTSQAMDLTIPCIGARRRFSWFSCAVDSMKSYMNLSLLTRSGLSLTGAKI